MKNSRILQQLRARHHALTKSEQKVADFVLKRPQDVIHMRIVDLATESRVSEPTIVRFCRAIGLDSFQNFKLSLAQQLVRSEALVPFAVDAADRPVDLGRKLINNTRECLALVRDSMDWEAVQRAISKLSQARHVSFWGFGASGIVAQDAQQKFFRLTAANSAHSDPDRQHMLAVTLGPEDCVLAISHSGHSPQLLDNGQMAQERGASLIALCPPHTPLFQQCDIALPVAIDEDNETFTPMNARLAQLVMLDMLATGVYLQKTPDIDPELERIKLSLERSKQPR
ncbi:MAG: SIS domain-containing protein [Oleiphilaceae bacterium]|nr:SIS domain-containing protein [Oleiphilaceae bacterium]